MDHGFSVEHTSASDVILKNEAFYPDIPTADFRARFAISSALKEALLLDFIALAIISINRQLEGQQAIWKREGYKTLAAVSAPVIGEQSSLLSLYQSAIFYAAYASIESSEYRQVRSTQSAEERTNNAALYWQKSAFAVAGLCQKGQVQAVII